MFWFFFFQTIRNTVIVNGKLSIWCGRRQLTRTHKWAQLKKQWKTVMQCEVNAKLIMFGSHSYRELYCRLIGILNPLYTFSGLGNPLVSETVQGAEHVGRCEQYSLHLFMLPKAQKQGT